MKLFGAVILFLFWPLSAHAEPVTTFLATVAFAGVTYGQIIFIVGSYLYGSAQQKKAERNSKNAERARIAAYNAGLKDRTITQIATEAPHRYVYGRARVGSDIVAIFTSGDRDQYKHLVCIHAAHECDGFEDIYIAGKKIAALDGNGWVTGAPFYNSKTEAATESKTSDSFSLANLPINGSLRIIGRVRQDSGGDTRDLDQDFQFTISGLNVIVTPPLDSLGASYKVTYQYTIYTPYVNVRKHLGTPTDPVDPYLNAVTGGAWAASSVLRDKCYTVITLNIDEPEFQGGIPSIEVVLRGKKLFDPRYGYAYWSQNPALVINDYLRSEICGVSAADIPLASLITAANTCDEAQSFGPRYVFNGAITSDQGQSNVLERMAQSMAGGIVSTTWDIYAGKYVAPVLALVQTDIVGDIAITPGVSDADIYNGVRGQYISAENDYVPTDFKPFQNPVYVAADTRELWTDIDFPFTDNVQRVWNLARIFTEDQRNGYTVKASFSLKAWSLKVGQRVTLTSSLFGWNAKVFRVTDKSYSPSSPVELTLKEDDPSIWDFADAVVADSTANTNLPNPWAIDKIASVTCESGGDQLLLAQDGTIISRILVTWARPSGAVLTKGAIEIESSKVGSNTWSKLNADGDDTQAYIAPAEDGSFYTVRVRTTIPSLGVVSDWTYAALHQVIGKTEPPPDVETFSITNGVLSWPAVLDTLDLAGYLIRFHYGDNQYWSNATPLHEGFITDSPFRPVLIPPGVVTMMVKAVDTSGNVSLMPATILANFGDPIVENLILVYDDKAAGFPGEKTNSAVVGGNLLADDSGGLFWSNDNAPFWGLGNDNFWPTATYLPLTYSFDYLVSLDQVGSRLTLSASIEAASYNVEYRYGAPGPFWGADADMFWGEDGERFWASPSAWQTWPGAIENIGEVEIGFRVSAQGGTERAAITTLSLQFDVEDETEELDDIAISAAGTRLPVTKSYRSIKNILLTLQDNGGTARTAVVNDKLSTGPLIYCLNSAGTKVSGVIDARIQGVKG